MDNVGRAMLAGCFFGIVLTVIVASLWCPDLGNHYKQGQIDYANGIIKYELREQDNHEYIWVKKED